MSSGGSGGLWSDSRLWLGIVIGAAAFVVAAYVFEFDYKGEVLFDCPPVGDGSYVALDPHAIPPKGCKYFGPPLTTDGSDWREERVR